MKVIYKKWFGNTSRVFSIINYKDSWKKNGNKPRIEFFENGGRRKNGDKCFDVHLIIGYTIFNYCNYNLWYEVVKMKFYVQYFPITKSFGYIANPDNISLDSFCELVRASDEFCHSIVMSVFANSIRDVENDVNNYFKTIS